MNHRFTNEMNPSRAALVTDMLRGERLWVPTAKDYPLHGEWLERAEAELVAGIKRAMTMYDGQTPMGTIVYQRDKATPERVELKNISIHPDVRDRKVGEYLLRQVQVEAIMNDFPGIQTIGVDTKKSNFQMIGFLESQGYSQVREEDLYSSNMVDVILEKRVA